MRSMVCAATALCLVLPATARAHKDEKFLAARQAPWSGPGYKSVDGGIVPRSFSSSGLTLLGWVPLGDLDPTATTGADCWGYVSGSGREYALIATDSGTTVVEVTDPTNPVVIDTVDSVDSLWRDVKIYQDHAYAVSEGGAGINIIDLSQVDSGIVNYLGDDLTGSGTTSSHNVAIDEDSGFLYRCGGGSFTVEGLRIYDLSNPASPSFVASWNSRYVHDVQVVTFTSGPNAGKQLAYCFAEDTSGGVNPGIAIVDVTNKAAITEVSFTPYSSAVFSHQGWLSPDAQYLYIGDELDEQSFGSDTTARIMDVSNINAPFEVGTFTNNNEAIDHNMYTLGNLIFCANYRSGLRIFDATIPTAPVETAFFDTYPDDDIADFNGLWSVYPYLPSGWILGSDLESGLFIWKLGDPNLAFTFPSGIPTQVNPGGGTLQPQKLQVQIDELVAGDYQAGTATMHFDVGGGFTSTLMTDLGGGLFEASIPAGDCGSMIRFYVSAESTNGLMWRSPAEAPGSFYEAVAQVGSIISIYDEVESPAGWLVGGPGDGATTGVWEHGDPVGTGAQPEDDHSDDPESLCWVTGLSGASLGSNDVDGGNTTLNTPAFDLTSIANPVFSYWRWYSNNAGGTPGADIFEVEISNGGAWVNVETVGPTGPGTTGGWVNHRFLVSDFVTPNATVMLRFRVGDLGGGSIVEAAIDDLEVFESVCDLPAVTITGAPTPGHEFQVQFRKDAGDSIWALVGAAPQVSLNLPKYNGNLCILPFNTIFLTPNDPNEVIEGSLLLANDPGLIGAEVLFQALSGPQFGGATPDATWSNCAVLRIQ